MTNFNVPVLIGASQYTQSRNEIHPLDPLGLMAKSCGKALAQAAQVNLNTLIDSVYMVNINSWCRRDAIADLCRELGLKPRNTFYSSVGGNSPQTLVNRAARAIARGETRGVLITGGEAYYSVRRAVRGELNLDWPKQELPARVDGDQRLASTELEMKYGLNAPVNAYPLFETSLRASLGRSLEEHKERVGRLCERFSRAASQNPFAWQRKPLSASEITAPGPDNRYVVYPYTKRMIANLDVDMSAALVMTDEKTAIELGIAQEQLVYIMGGADLNNIWYVTERPRIHESPAVRQAARLSLEQAGLSLDDISRFDLYSCFPCAVQIAAREIGIAEDDPRELTMTGGLAYFGQPFNNYSMHAIVTAFDRIKSDRSLNAMVVSLGWYNTKYSVAIYGAKPPAHPWGERDDAAIQAAIDKEALPPLVEKATGGLLVEAYQIMHNRSGQPEQGTVLGRLDNGGRCLANIDAKGSSLERFEQMELVGRTGEVRFDAGLGRNLVTFPAQFQAT